MRHGLLAIDVFSCENGSDNDFLVPVIRHSRDNAVDFPVVQKFLVASCCRDAGTDDFLGVEWVAACDLYDGRHRLAKEIVGVCVATTSRYQELLLTREIDGIVAPAPPQCTNKTVRAS